MAERGSLKDRVLQYVKDRFGTEANFPWSDGSQNVVLRHGTNGKWYGIIMEVPRDRLGLEGNGKADVLNLRPGPTMTGSLIGQPGILPAYHMNKENWVSVLLDGTVDMDTIELLLEISYDGTRPGRRRGKAREKPAIHQWLIPANPAYYDLRKGFAENRVLTWKQSSNISVGDTVYIYEAAPVSAVTYKCRAVEVDIPREYSDKNVRMKKTMRIELLHTFGEGRLGREFLQKYGVNTVRGPRGIPNSLLRAMERAEEEEDGDRV